ncbi:MAG TPA: branched-chain amino acid ABC transporter ATP-binding protein/permease [Trebonia sp.]|nr:branched-chain amino acid ABC transporter ATP-binding protein/permease [Trebonia sp.]
MQLTVSYLDEILVLLIFTVSLNLVMGYAGVFNAAAGAFGAIGGYSLVWLTASHGMAFIPAMLIGVAVTAVFGLLVGYAALRLQALWLLLLTLAVQLVLIGTLSGLTSLGGSSGLQANNLNIFGYQLVEPTQVLPVVAVGAVLVFLLCYRIGESPYGRVLRGIRDDETATRSLGKNTFSYKLIVFTLTAAMAGFGGALLSADTTTASPSLFGFDVSIQVIAMVIIGGTANMFGSVIGVALVVLSTPFFENVIHLSTNTASLAQGLAYGLALVVVVFFRPQGIIPEGIVPWRWRRAAPVPAVAEGDPGPRPASAPVPAPLVTVRSPRPSATGAAGDGGGSVLEVRGLSKSFGGNKAVNDLSFDLHRGKITALIGPNGAGKTTVFNLITGAIPADAGQVRLFGQDITGQRPDVITGLGMARSFQDVRVFPSLTVLENIMLGIQDQPGDEMRNLFARPREVARAERAARSRAREWLRFIDMEPLAGVRAGSLGFGQQKLVALARILATDSEVLLLDEPGSGIDHAWIDQMVAVVKQVSEAGRTVCIVEHNLEVVGRLADHVCFMELGRLTAEGSCTDLTSDPRLTEAYFGTV